MQFYWLLASVKTIIYTSNIQVTAWLSRYCLSNWQAKDEAIFKQLLKTVHPGILKLQGKRAVLKQYDTIIDKGFHAFTTIPESKPTKDIWYATANL
jgi:hypothetical protein